MPDSNNLPPPNNDSPTPPPASSPDPGQPSATPPPFPVEDEDISATHHLGAEDLDLIEKEWVLKAKEVVDHTQGDPYKQSQALSKIRADYIKKRYNRTIKSNE